jgi:DNA-binding response OmpR family regulator
MPSILIVEDDRAMLEGLSDNLRIEGYTVDGAGDGAAGLDQLMRNTYDLAILDVMLPKLSGFDLLRRLREKGMQVPVIMLTAKGEEIDKVLGLELGADDYITKPFGLRELLARVKAVLRRNESGGGPAPAQRITIGNLEINFRTYTAVRKGKPVEMTPKEIDILKFLWEHRDQTVSRDQLLTNVWGYDDSISSRTVDNFILKLRHKIEEYPADPKVIITVHGLGYKLIAIPRP